MEALARFEDAAGARLGAEWPNDDVPAWRELSEDEWAERRAFRAEYGMSD